MIEEGTLLDVDLAGSRVAGRNANGLEAMLEIGGYSFGKPVEDYGDGGAGEDGVD